MQDKAAFLCFWFFCVCFLFVWLFVFNLWGWPNTGVVFPERLWSLHLRRYSKPDQTLSRVTSSSWPCLSRAGWTRWSWRVPSYHSYSVILLRRYTLRSQSITAFQLYSLLCTHTLFFFFLSTQCLPEQVKNKPPLLFTACVQHKHSPDLLMIIVNY